MIIVVYISFAVLLTIVIVLSILTCISVSNEEEIDLETTEQKKESTDIDIIAANIVAAAIRNEDRMRNIRIASPSGVRMCYKVLRYINNSEKRLDAETAKEMIPHKPAMPKLKD